MKDRIRQIMEAKHMTQQVFAQFIEMSPASLSSVFSGRTRPTLNIVEAIKRKIPEVNIDWLLFGSGTMFDVSRSDDAGTDSPQPAVEGESTLDFGADPASPHTGQSVPPTTPSAIAGRNDAVRSPRHETLVSEVKFVERPQRHVTEIRVYYDDLTYETFVPAKK